MTKTKFLSNNDTQEWMFIMMEGLGKQAMIEQSYINGDRESNLCEVLHLCRTYILNSLKDSVQFEQLRQLSVEKYMQVKKEIAIKRVENKNTGNLIQDRDSLAMVLAYWGDRTTLFEAIDFKLFDKLKVIKRDALQELLKAKNLDPSKLLKEYNEEIPLCLQPNADHLIYALSYQEQTKISFDDFVKKALESKQLDEQKEEESPTEKNDTSLSGETVAKEIKKDNDESVPSTSIKKKARN